MPFTSFPCCYISLNTLLRLFCRQLLIGTSLRRAIAACHLQHMALLALCYYAAICRYYAAFGRRHTTLLCLVTGCHAIVTLLRCFMAMVTALSSAPSLSRRAGCRRLVCHTDTYTI